MPLYFFHLDGKISARDMAGHECVSDAQAKEHASFIAHRIGTEKPEMVQAENSIAVENNDRDVIARIPLASTAT
jgi:hypothetical protein